MLLTTIFSKYTELLQLKNIFRIFWNYFGNILEINVFQNINQSLCKKCGFFLKIADIDNNKLMGLFLIAGWSLLLSQEYIKEKRKQRKLVRLRIRNRDSIGAYYSIINGLSLTDKKDLRKYLRMNILPAIATLLFYLNENWNYEFPLFLYCASGHYQKVIDNSCLFLSLRDGTQKTKQHILLKWGCSVFYSKK